MELRRSRNGLEIWISIAEKEGKLLAELVLEGKEKQLIKRALVEMFIIKGLLPEEYQTKPIIIMDKRSTEEGIHICCKFVDILTTREEKLANVVVKPQLYLSLELSDKYIKDSLENIVELIEDDKSNDVLEKTTIVVYR